MLIPFFVAFELSDVVTYVEDNTPDTNWGVLRIDQAAAHMLGCPFVLWSHPGDAVHGTWRSLQATELLQPHLWSFIVILSPS
eukprot:SAG31_NODE_827_length_11749_cov_14.363090_12_plen_82_part_00